MKPSLQEEIIQDSDTTTTTKPSSNTKQVHNSQQAAAGHQKCPRCDSTNTKFCYYNNYSLTQPRHFCKTCRRYWTKGGALRNVPIGGGCRKTKKLKSSSSSSASSSTNNFKFFAAMPPSIDFGVGLSSLSSSPLFSRSCVNLDPHLTPTSPTTSNYPFTGLSNNNNNYNTCPLILHYNNNIMNSNADSQLASSIESLSSLNQDLHWKLQQQRLAAMFGEHGHHQVQNFDHQNQKLLQPILFQNLEAPKQDTCFNINNHTGKESVAAAGEDATTTTEWFFGNNNNNNSLSAANSARNYDIDGSGWSHNNDANGVQAWENLHHFTALP